MAFKIRQFLQLEYPWSLGVSSLPKYLPMPHLFLDGFFYGYGYEIRRLELILYYFISEHSDAWELITGGPGCETLTSRNRGFSDRSLNLRTYVLNFDRFLNLWTCFDLGILEMVSFATKSCFSLLVEWGKLKWF
ncbi:hypothetical protein RCL_jg8403.t2 [Rhizophagus clarus]|uniref:Uncharacterized protein n=1 Tax=Rhizophagus clarus TaxID=94130 RepID=A0A8H3R4L8_9GLOM|nr:hypothetical protein RCL_jg8403.t2 [Rhizophagus clarus]